MTLGRTVEPRRGELPSSLVARLAVANGVPRRQFALHMGFEMRRLDSAAPDQVSRLRSLLAWDPYAWLAPPLCRDGAGNRLGALKIHATDLGIQRPRICPACVGEDLANGTEPLHGARVWYRSAWAVQSVLTCRTHGCFLAGLADTGVRRSFDLQDRVNRSPGSFASIPRGDEPIGDSPFEDWAWRKLENETTQPGLLDQFEFYVAANLVERVGMTICFGNQARYKDFAIRERHKACAAGFATAQHGFDDFLSGIFDSMPQRGIYKPRIVGGRFLQWLHDTRRNPDYAALKDLVRERAIDRFPLGPGDDFMGPVTRRSLHSVTSAYRELGRARGYLRKILIAEGILSADASPLPALATFPAECIEQIRRGFDGAMSQQDAEAYLNVYDVQFRSFLKAGLVTGAFTKADHARPAYKKVALDEFLEAVMRAKGKGGNLVSLINAARLASCDHADIARLLIDQSLERIYLDPTKRGYRSIKVDIDELRQAVGSTNDRWLPEAQVQQRIHVHTRGIHCLKKAGLLPFKFYYHRKDGRHGHAVTEAGVRKFLDEYISAKELSILLGIPHYPKGAVKRAADSGIKPTLVGRYPGITVFKRAEVQVLLKK